MDLGPYDRVVCIDDSAAGDCQDRRCPFTVGAQYTVGRVFKRGEPHPDLPAHFRAEEDIVEILEASLPPLIRGRAARLGYFARRFRKIDPGLTDIARYVQATRRPAKEPA